MVLSLPPPPPALSVSLSLSLLACHPISALFTSMSTRHAHLTVSSTSPTYVPPRCSSGIPRSSDSNPCIFTLPMHIPYHAPPYHAPSLIVFCVGVEVGVPDRRELHDRSILYSLLSTKITARASTITSFYF